MCVALTVFAGISWAGKLRPLLQASNWLAAHILLLNRCFLKTLQTLLRLKLVGFATSDWPSVAIDLLAGLALALELHSLNVWWIPLWRSLAVVSSSGRSNEWITRPRFGQSRSSQSDRALSQLSVQLIFSATIPKQKCAQNLLSGSAARTIISREFALLF